MRGNDTRKRGKYVIYSDFLGQAGIFSCLSAGAYKDIIDGSGLCGGAWHSGRDIYQREEKDGGNGIGNH